jgi:hypothetical protein
MVGGETKGVGTLTTEPGDCIEGLAVVVQDSCDACCCSAVGDKGILSSEATSGDSTLGRPLMGGESNTSNSGDKSVGAPGRTWV